MFLSCAVKHGTPSTWAIFSSHIVSTDRIIFNCEFHQVALQASGLFSPLSTSAAIVDLRKNDTSFEHILMVCSICPALFSPSFTTSCKVCAKMHDALLLAQIVYLVQFLQLHSLQSHHSLAHCLYYHLLALVQIQGALEMLFTFDALSVTIYLILSVISYSDVTSSYQETMFSAVCLP